VLQSPQEPKDPSPGSSVETLTEGYGIQIIGSYGGSMREGQDAADHMRDDRVQ
jgi:hypothetical protein